MCITTCNAWAQSAQLGLPTLPWRCSAQFRFYVDIAYNLSSLENMDLRNQTPILLLAPLLMSLASCGDTSVDQACKKVVAVSEGKVDMDTCKKQMVQAKKEFGEEKTKKILTCLEAIENMEGMKGCLAAVVPEELKEYAAKSKGIEASSYLRKMSDGARTYYELGALTVDSADLSMVPKAKSLPASVGPTPPKGECCKKGDRCIPQPEQWEDPSWKALDFAMQDPHYYSYEFVRGEDGKSFVASAYGDLDCDGEYSTFRINGALVGEEFQITEVQKTNPLE